MINGIGNPSNAIEHPASRKIDTIAHTMPNPPAADAKTSDVVLARLLNASGTDDAYLKSCAGAGSSNSRRPARPCQCAASAMAGFLSRMTGQRLA